MLIYIEDAISNASIAINPEHVVSVLTIPEGEHVGKTALILTSGNIITNENLLDVVGRLNGELK